MSGNAAGLGEVLPTALELAGKIVQKSDKGLEVQIKRLFPSYSSPRSFLKRENRSPAVSTAQSKGIRLVFKTMW